MTIKERIERATARLGKAKADQIIQSATQERCRSLTLYQMANILETAAAEQGIVGAVSLSASGSVAPQNWASSLRSRRSYQGARN